MVPTGGAVKAVDRRREGFAGVAGDLFTSGERVVVAVADVARRRQGLEAIVAGLAPEGVCVVSWKAIEADAAVTGGFDHLVALDPPPGGRADPLLCRAPRAHLAWGPAEAEFALLVARAELDLRPALEDAYRALRVLPSGASKELVHDALCGGGRYARSPELCARLALVLRELELVEIALEEPHVRVYASARKELESSPTYRASLRRLGEVEHALGAEMRRSAGAARAA